MVIYLLMKLEVQAFIQVVRMRTVNNSVIYLLINKEVEQLRNLAYTSNLI